MRMLQAVVQATRDQARLARDLRGVFRRAGTGPWWLSCEIGLRVLPIALSFIFFYLRF